MGSTSSSFSDSLTVDVQGWGNDVMFPTRRLFYFTAASLGPLKSQKTTEHKYVGYAVDGSEIVQASWDAQSKNIKQRFHETSSWHTWHGKRVDFKSTGWFVVPTVLTVQTCANKIWIINSKASAEPGRTPGHLAEPQGHQKKGKTRLLQLWTCFQQCRTHAFDFLGLSWNFQILSEE